MTKEEKAFEKVQGEAIELIKQKKGNKTMKAPKEIKTFTTKQIVKATFINIAILACGIFIGVTSTNLLNDTINRQVKEQTAEQVKSFTEAVEVKE